jgi:hypothetical protein
MTAFARFAFSSGAEVERAYEVLQADVPRHERDCAAGPPRKVEITAENVQSDLQRVDGDESASLPAGPPLGLVPPVSIMRSGRKPN